MPDGGPVSRREVTLDDVLGAARRIDDLVVRTPLLEAGELEDRLGVPVLLKLESLQPTGSFKVRGAASRIRALDPEAAGRGVVTASTGNHGRAVAHIARELDVDATICLSDRVPTGKVAALRELGCELRIGGDSQDEAMVTARQLADHGATLVHPFDDPEVIAGQGTIGLELVEQRPDVETVLVPLSGGGLLAGVAVAVRELRPDAVIIGVSMRHGAAMAASLQHGSPVELPEVATLADSLQGGIGLDNRHTLALVAELVDDVVLVDEQAIWDGMRLALERHRVVLEGAAAVGIAALLSREVVPEGPTVVVCSGGNAEQAQVEALARRDPHPPG